jgi:phosphoserine aminotransferase
MSRVHNFSAGPAALPEAVLRQAQAELLEWNSQGASVMELSHRGQAFIDMAAEAERDLRELMAIPAEYAVAFLQGGATLIQALLPLNFAAPGQAIDYVLTGHWGEKAVDQALPYADVRIAASAEGNGYTEIPARALWQLRDDAAYLHITSNETIHGVEFADTPEASRAPLIADMSSSILSRSVDVSRYGMIYAGAQKNIGPSGIGVAIIHPELLARAGQLRAPILNIGNHLKHDSMLNTPPTFAWYLAGLVFKHLKQLGGVAAIEAINRRKAQRLYAVIDGSDGFYRNRVDPACRSRMNVPFFLANDVLEADFLKHATANGLIGLKGHRVVGGIRASIYNAVTEASVETLAQFMIDFAQRKA